jgi:hypothetical protein
MINRLVSLGNVIIDIVADVPALPERGGDVLASGVALEVEIRPTDALLISGYGLLHGANGLPSLTGFPGSRRRPRCITTPGRSVTPCLTRW